MRGARLGAVVLLLTLGACDRDAVRVDGQALSEAPLPPGPLLGGRPAGQ